MRGRMENIIGIVISPVETYKNLLSAEEKLGILELTEYIGVIAVLGIITENIAMFVILRSVTGGVTMFTNILIAIPIFLIFGFWSLWLYALAVRENYQPGEVPEKVIFKERAGIGNGPIIVTFAVFVFLLYSSLGHRIGYFVSVMLYFTALLAYSTSYYLIIKWRA